MTKLHEKRHIMGRPTTKADLISAANENLTKLWQLVDSLPEAAQEADFNYGEAIAGKKEAHWLRDKNLRDVLVHLYEWHQLLLNWIGANQSGEKKPFIPEPYDWKTYGDMNIEFWQKHQSTSLENAKEMLKKSHSDVMKVIDGFSNDDLFAKAKFSWTGTSSLGSYCVSATASHYDWAIKKIKLYIKIRKEVK